MTYPAWPARKGSRVEKLTVRLNFLHDRGVLFNIQDVLQDLGMGYKISSQKSLSYFFILSHLQLKNKDGGLHRHPTFFGTVQECLEDLRGNKMRLSNFKAGSTLHIPVLHSTHRR